MCEYAFVMVIFNFIGIQPLCSALGGLSGLLIVEKIYSEVGDITLLLEIAVWSYIIYKGYKKGILGMREAIKKVRAKW